MDTLPTHRIVEPRTKIRDEILVEFPSISIRDAVKSSGFKLEGIRAGIRMEVPHFLKSDFHVLQNLSYKLKMVNREMKRSLKFDDDNHGLMLDIQLPGEDWRRIRPDQARRARETNPDLRTGPEEMTGPIIAGVAKGTTSANFVLGASFRSRAGSCSSAPSHSSHPQASATGGNATPLGGTEDRP